jgi:NADPH-dependent curcumin reductase CurA
MDKVPAAAAQLHEWVRGGQIHILENITEGLPNAGWAYSEMMRGATIGKNLVAMDLRDDE